MRFLRFVLVLALIPFLVSFDTLVYWLTRPSCLNCGSLSSYIQTASLSAAMVAGALGYSFKKKA